MDGFHDDGYLTLLVDLWDYLEGFYYRKFNLRIAAFILLTASLAKARCWSDLFGILALVSWLTGFIPPALRGLVSLTHLAIFAFVISGSVSTTRKQDLHELAKPADVVAHCQPIATRRHATQLEVELEKVFRGYLQHLVTNSRSSIAVEYIPYGMQPTSIMMLRRVPEDTDEIRMVFKVLNPEFYTRFVHYAHDSEAIFSELAENHTIWVDRPDLLTDVFLKKASPPLRAQGVVDFLTFELIRKLRKRPRILTMSAQATSVGGRSVSDIREFRISSMDAYVLSQDDRRIKQIYRTAVLELFVAENYFGGSYSTVTVALTLLRLVMWGAVAVLSTDTVSLI